MLEESRVLDALAANGITADMSQRAAIAALVELVGCRVRCGFLQRRRVPHGVYCYGLPGRGKSLIVDTVFAHAPCRKRRIHFHEFLREMNLRLVNKPGTRGDRLSAIVKRWLAGVELLCFDEFHVHDIADAFLMGRFLDTALGVGTRIVLTSNYAPHDLLPDPRFHERFKPTIEQICDRFNVIHFDGARDYRAIGQDAALPRFFSPLTDETSVRLQDIFLRYEELGALRPHSIVVAGRPLCVRASGNGVVWVEFERLCVANRSHIDYLELAERWRGLIVDNVRSTLLESPNTLQRLIWLVDIFYDRKHALFMASDMPIHDALTGLEGAHDMSRTLSRLREMQSHAYASTLDEQSTPLGTAICHS